MPNKELGFLKPSLPSGKLDIARKTLSIVRSKGHTYVDLREEGKGFVFFCTLCFAQCHSDNTLMDHLNGNPHRERFLAAKATLMKSNPWPYDDGILFFRNVEGKEENVGSHGGGNARFFDEDVVVGDLAIVAQSDVSRNGENGDGNGNGNDVVEFDLVIPGVIRDGKILDLGVRLTGYGQISCRVFEGEEGYKGVSRMWCEWLGKMGGEDDEIHSRASSYDFGIVTFSYFYDLGKRGLLQDIKTLILSADEDDENGNGSTKRRKKLVSDTEVDSETTLSDRRDSSEEDSPGSADSGNLSLLIQDCDDRHLRSRVIANRTLRREVRELQHAASEKMCDICKQKMICGKDVAALLNLKTGKLACSSRNVNGAFHVFHTSCLIHWILICEHEMFMKPPVRTSLRRSRRKTKSKFSHLRDCEQEADCDKANLSSKATETGTIDKQIRSVFCPDCQGTGVEVDENELENPSIPLKQILDYKLQVTEAHKAWMNCPEELDNCSIGFRFPVEADNCEEKVVNMKLLQFYRADEEDSWIQNS